MREDDVQKAIVKHLRWRGHPSLIPIHINNTPRSRIDGARLKAMGLVAGAPDMLYAGHGGLVIWHEIKTKDGRLSTVQKDFHERLEDLNHVVLVTYGLDDALEQLTERRIIIGG